MGARSYGGMGETNFPQAGTRDRRKFGALRLRAPNFYQCGGVKPTMRRIELTDDQRAWLVDYATNKPLPLVQIRSRDPSICDLGRRIRIIRSMVGVFSLRAHGNASC